jgi:hypothetical protein
MFKSCALALQVKQRLVTPSYKSTHRRGANPCSMHRIHSGIADTPALVHMQPYHPGLPCTSTDAKRRWVFMMTWSAVGRQLGSPTNIDSTSSIQQLLCCSAALSRSFSTPQPPASGLKLCAPPPELWVLLYEVMRPTPCASNRQACLSAFYQGAQTCGNSITLELHSAGARDCRQQLI